MEQESVLPPLRDKPYGGAWSIHDSESIAFIESIDRKEGNRQRFLDEYGQWFVNNKDFKGIEQYKHVDFSAGTTETFGQFYYQHINKRLRLLKGEYFYHWLMARNYFKSSLVIGDEPLRSGDVVVMSCPFADTGNIPDDFYKILEQCEDLQIPVMLDLAYINVSNISELDLTYKCIHTITTSLSKVFPVETHRIGIRLRRDFYDDGLFAYNQNDYVNLYSAHVGHELIKRFDNNWLYDKYRSQQAETCAELGVKPTSCVIFGIGQKGNYDEYNRGGKTNRLCFSKLWDKRINDNTQ